jgi:hypothetical protein
VRGNKSLNYLGKIYNCRHYRCGLKHFLFRKSNGKLYYYNPMSKIMNYSGKEGLTLSEAKDLMKK